MKTNITGGQHPTHPQTKPSKRPENKDTLDSREGEEQSDKGDDITHNEKKSTEILKRKIKNRIWNCCLQRVREIIKPK